MTDKTKRFPKLSMPDVSGIPPRLRLIELLDQVKQKIIFVSAPGGSGKTTVVASYLEAHKLPCIWYSMDSVDSDAATFLHYVTIAAKSIRPGVSPDLPTMTPEYLQRGIKSFAKKYCETLYCFIRDYCLKNNLTGLIDRHFYIVLDNYHEISPDSEVHEIISEFTALLPDGIKIIFITRNVPPSYLSQLMEKGSVALIDWNDIKFTLDESRSIINKEIQAGLMDRFLKDVHEKTRGWAAGMILMFEKARFGRMTFNSEEDIESDGLFDIYAGDVFDKADRALKIFLLKTAFLPDISVITAEKMTGSKNAGQILSNLNSQNYFTEKLTGFKQEFKYHPLFRKFLLKRASEELSDTELYSTKKTAAEIAEQSEKTEVAAIIFFEIEDWQGLSRIIINNARSFLMQGRNKTIEEWITYFPEDMLQNSPWLIYWQGMCSFPFDMPRTRSFLEKAFSLFEETSDQSGIYLSWAGIVDSYAFERDEWMHLDHYIDMLEGLFEKYAPPDSMEIDLIVSSRMLISLTLRKTDRPEWVNEWYLRVSRLLEEKPSIDIHMDTIFCMSIYYLWIGEYNRNSILLEKADNEILAKKPSPFSVIRIKLMRGIHCWVSAMHEEAMLHLSEGLQIAERSGVHVFDSLLWSFIGASEMARGELTKASKSLKRQLASLAGTSNSLDLFFFHINSAWLEILNGRPYLASENLSAISSMASKMGSPYYIALWNIGMGQVAIMKSSHDDAKKHIKKALEISRQMKSHILEWSSILIDAFIDLWEKREKDGLSKLEAGLSIGRQYGYFHLEFYQPEINRFLYATALEKGIEQAYVYDIIKKLGFPPPESALYIEEWPWPVKIYTLGRFEIIINDIPLVFQGKEPKKPIEMLKALIAMGGRNVPEEKLTDALWPDATGDLASKSFETNLGRLRRILGGNNLVKYTSGQLSLDRSCWVDSLAFADIYLQSKKETFHSPLLREKGIDLYKGVFLPSDSNFPWVLSKRETLNSYQVRMILATGRNIEEKEDWGKAADFYLRGLDSEILSEEFYQRLMICYIKLGRMAEALKIYNTCRKVLKEYLDLPPSAETDSIFSSISDR